MTNREKLAQMSNWELGEFICNHHTFCVNCIAQDICGRNIVNGMKIWLESEAEEDNG